MKILVTGASGFIGKNLSVRIAENASLTALPVTRDDTAESLTAKLSQADIVVNLAGENRPKDPGLFWSGNVDSTRQLCDLIKASGRYLPIIHVSSAQAEQDNTYGKSKLAGEDVIKEYASATGAAVQIYRLPNVFGKWCRPNYNSVVATFCYNIARDIPIHVDNPATILRLVYVDDVVSVFLDQIEKGFQTAAYADVEPVYEISLGALAAQIADFAKSRQNLITQPVGVGLTRALYSTYVSYLAPAKFSYEVIAHRDERGEFVEMIKTPDCGQFSYFTAKPGVTRGGHYHHSKTEKFLVLKGKASFRFRHIVTHECHQLSTEGGAPRIVETVPGWTHDITNVGTDELVVMLWANEIFDPSRPDTIAKSLDS